jgi:hypothetical protein
MVIVLFDPALILPSAVKQENIEALLKIIKTSGGHSISGAILRFLCQFSISIYF